MDGMLKRPKWSLKTSFLVAVILLVALFIVVWALVHKSIWARLELITSILAGLMFLYLFGVLYFGVRFDKHEKYEIGWPSWKPWEAVSYMGFVDTGGAFASAAADAGPLGCLIGLLLDIIVSLLLTILIALLLWLGTGVLLSGIVIIFIPLFLLFRRSIRVVVARGRRSRGDIRRSFSYALGYTAISVLWLYLILFAGHYIAFRAGWLKG